MIVRTRQRTGRLTTPPVSAATQQTLQHGSLKWLDLMQPSPEQISSLREKYNFHPLHLEDVLSHLQRPKIDDYPEGGYLFLVMHYPVFNKADRLSIPSEVDVFVGRDYLITVHDGKLKPLVRLVKTAGDEQVRAQLMGRGSGYLLYRITEVLINSCFPMLYRVDQNLDVIETGVFSSNAQKMVEELSFVRRDIISLRRIVKPNIPVVRSLEIRERDFLRVDEEEYFGDLTDGLSKLWDMLEEQKEIIEGLDDTLNNLTSHRINEEMKVFTMISVIFLPMTLVASVLGMNVIIPFSQHPLALPISLLFMVLIGIGMVFFFRYKNWI
jgi:magnesium transporter